MPAQVAPSVRVVRLAGVGQIGGWLEASAPPWVFALLCARLAAFFSRRKAARTRRCLAWIFFRRESVILGMDLDPLL